MLVEEEFLLTQLPSRVCLPPEKRLIIDILVIAEQDAVKMGRFRALPPNIHSPEELFQQMWDFWDWMHAPVTEAFSLAYICWHLQLDDDAVREQFTSRLTRPDLHATYQGGRDCRGSFHKVLGTVEEPTKKRISRLTLKRETYHRRRSKSYRERRG